MRAHHICGQSVDFGVVNAGRQVVPVFLVRGMVVIQCPRCGVNLRPDEVYTHQQMDEMVQAGLDALKSLVSSRKEQVNHDQAGAPDLHIQTG